MEVLVLAIALPLAAATLLEISIESAASAAIVHVLESNRQVLLVDLGWPEVSMALMGVLLMMLILHHASLVVFSPSLPSFWPGIQDLSTFSISFWHNAVAVPLQCFAFGAAASPMNGDLSRFSSAIFQSSCS